MHKSMMMTMMTMQAYPAALEVGGTCQAGRAGKLFFVPLHFFGFTSTVSRSGMRYCVVSTV